MFPSHLQAKSSVTAAAVGSDDILDLSLPTTALKPSKEIPASSLSSIVSRPQNFSLWLKEYGH